MNAPGDGNETITPPPRIEEISGRDQDVRPVGRDQDVRPCGRIGGVRPCLRCGHDLHGQSILREPEHGLFIARCPECGTVAALTEYPTLGVWGRRLGNILMATMIALLIPLALLSGLALFGIAALLFDELVRDARVVLETMAAAPNEQILPEWWIANGGEARLRMLRVFLTFDRQETMIAVALSPLPMLIGILWSAILCGMPRRRLWLAAPAMGGVACLFIGVMLLDRVPLGTVPVWSYSAAFQAMAWPGMIALILAETILMTIGLLLGRTLFRLLASFALPPRSRLMVSFLWTIDGLDPPRGRG